MKEDELQKVQIVGPVNTTTGDPWRTQGDYREEQAQMLKAYRWAVGASVAAIVTALCSIVLAYTAVVEIKNISAQVQNVKQNNQPQQKSTKP